jgi:protein arginine kinase
MAERRTVSPEFAKNRSGRAIFLSKDESVAVIVNEEDHIRIQVLSSGSDLPVCLKIAGEIDALVADNCSVHGFSQECNRAKCTNSV